MKKILFIFVITVKYFNAISQSAFSFEVDDVQQDIHVYTRLNKQEYLSGETIYYHTWLRYANQNLKLPTNAKVILASESKKIIYNDVLPIIDGELLGSLKLSTSIESDRYFLYVYPINENGNIIYNPEVAELIIINPTYSLLPSIKKYNRKYIIQPYYTSKTLITNISNDLFLKAEDQYHQPIATILYLVENGLDTLQKVETNTYGSGEVKFIPLPDSKYTIDYKDEFNIVHSMPLTVHDRGVTSFVSVKDSFYILSFFFSDNLLGSNVRISGTANYQQIFKQDAQINDQHLMIKIPLNILPTGIFCIKVNDKNDEILSRIFAFSPNKEGVESVKVIKDNFLSDSLSEVKITYGFKDTNIISDNLNILAESNNFKEYRIINDDNILNKLFLTSKLSKPVPFLQGYIKDIDTIDLHEINQILNCNDIKTSEFDNSFTKTDQDSLNVVEYIALKGAIFDASSKCVKIEGVIEKDNKVIDFVSAPIMENGTFVLSSLLFYDSAKFVYTFKSKKGDICECKKYSIKNIIDSLREFEISIDNTIVDYFKPIVWNKYSLEDSTIQRFIKMTDALQSEESNVKTLKGIVVSSKNTWREKSREIEGRYISDGLFKGQSTYDFNFLADPPKSVGLSVMAYLRQIAIGRWKLEKLLYGEMSLNGHLNQNTSFFLNEQRVTSDLLETVNLSDVAIVKCFYKGFIASELNNGAIIVYTKKPEDLQEPDLNYSTTISLKGYSTLLKFTTEPVRINFVPLPITHLWEPFGNVNQEYRFISNKSNTRVEIIVEGILPNGQVVYGHTR